MMLRSCIAARAAFFGEIHPRHVSIFLAYEGSKLTQFSFLALEKDGHMRVGVAS